MIEYYLIAERWLNSDQPAIEALALVIAVWIVGSTWYNVSEGGKRK